MTEHVWSAIRTQAITGFNGELPNAATEAAILEVFQLMPTIVIRTLNEVAEQVAQGKARSGWAVTKARLTEASTNRDVRVQGNERERAVELSERWIRTTGLHFDREAEILDDLFGDRGRLRPWAKDQTLRTRMLNLWHEHRPTGEHLEAEAEQRADHWKNTRADVLARLAVLKREQEEAAAEELRTAIAAKERAGDIPF